MIRNMPAYILAETDAKRATIFYVIITACLHFLVRALTPFTPLPTFPHTMRREMTNQGTKLAMVMRNKRTYKNVRALFSMVSVCMKL